MLLTKRMSCQYRSLMSKMECRKDIVKKLQRINRKAYAKSLPFWDSLTHKINNNRKKTIFFIVVMAYGVYKQWPTKIYNRYQMMEPLSAKIDRFLLGIDSRVPSTIRQQNTIGLTLHADSVRKLTKLYFELDRQLPYGVGRNILFNVYQQMGLLQKDDEKRSFWTASGYYKERNQKMSGVTCDNFLLIFDQALKKLKISKPQLSESDALWQFQEQLRRYFPIERENQQNIKKTRKQEYSKVSPDDWNKQLFIGQLMQKGLDRSIEIVEKEVINQGHQGLACKDQHQIVRLRLMNKIVQRSLLLRKMESRSSEFEKVKKYRQKLTILENEISQLTAQQQSLEARYRQIYGSNIY